MKSARRGEQRQNRLCNEKLYGEYSKVSLLWRHEPSFPYLPLKSLISYIVIRKRHLWVFSHMKHFVVFCLSHRNIRNEPPGEQAV